MLPVLEGLTDRKSQRRIKVDHKTIAGIRKGSRPQKSVDKLVALAMEIAAGQPVEERSPEAAAFLAEARIHAT